MAQKGKEERKNLAVGGGVAVGVGRRRWQSRCGGGQTCLQLQDGSRSLDDDAGDDADLFVGGKLRKANFFEEPQ